MSLPELHNHAEDLWTLPTEQSWSTNLRLKTMALLMSTIGIRSEIKSYENPATKEEHFNTDFYEQIDTAVNKSRALKTWFGNILAQGRKDIIGHEVRAAVDLAVEINIALGIAENINASMKYHAESTGHNYAFKPVDEVNLKQNRERVMAFISAFSNHDGYDCIRTDYYNNVL